MTVSSADIEEWIAHDPDPDTVAELRGCTDDELAERFSTSLTFGTAGLRGQVRGGPNGMNLAVVTRTTFAVAQVLKKFSRPTDTTGCDNRTVIVGRDARHGSDSFAAAAAEVLTAQGFDVTLLPRPLPTPVLAFAVRHTGALAGIQITASHNPPADNGYKVYWSGGAQIIAPTDRQIESAIASAPFADMIARAPVSTAGDELVNAYIARAATVRRTTGEVRLALTALHGVGGSTALEALHIAGITDVHCVSEQFNPDPDFPTVTFPNPEEPGASDAVLKLAAKTNAEIAVALDPDADRCAIGIPTATGWRMLSGDETGWLLGDYLLSLHQDAQITPVVASTIVSSRMLARIAATYGAHHVETLTGFKWLVRAADTELLYAYEEAIGHCVDPAAVRDKDGISAAILACDLVVYLRQRGQCLQDKLDELETIHGVHMTSQVSRRVGSLEETTALMARLRASVSTALANLHVEVEDLLNGPSLQRTDAVILTKKSEGTTTRLVIRPSGTEPKVKCYIEVQEPSGSDLEAARHRAVLASAKLAEYALNI